MKAEFLNTKIYLAVIVGFTLAGCGQKSSKASSDQRVSKTSTVYEGGPEDNTKPTNPLISETPPASSDIPAIVASLDKDFKKGKIRRMTDVADLAQKPMTIRQDLMEAFCIHSYKLPLKADFSAEFAILCDANKKPTTMFSDIGRYVKVNPSNPTAIEIFNSADAQYSKSIVISASEVPIAPKFVKEAHIQNFMTASANFDYFKQDSKVVKDLYDQIGGDLAFGRYELYYKTVNQTNDGKSFNNERSSQFNGYQVQGGNSDIGLGAEHMVGTNFKYKYFKTITVTIGTQANTSIIITIANVEVIHNGYPGDARNLAVDTATAQSIHVKEGVLTEKVDRIVK